jgi:hypothetical protein
MTDVKPLPFGRKARTSTGTCHASCLARSASFWRWTRVRASWLPAQRVCKWFSYLADAPQSAVPQPRAGRGAACGPHRPSPRFAEVGHGFSGARGIRPACKRPCHHWAIWLWLASTASGGRGDALVNGQHLFHTVELRVDQFVPGLTQDVPLPLRIGRSPVAGQPQGLVGRQAWVGLSCRRWANRLAGWRSA